MSEVYTGFPLSHRPGSPHFSASNEGGTVSRVLAYAPAVVWAALLLFIGGRSNVPKVESSLPLDKAAHFVLYGVLGILVTVGWARARFFPRLVWPVLLAIAVGGLDELHQRGVGSRSAEVADWVADTLGVLAAVLLLHRHVSKGTTDVV